MIPVTLTMTSAQHEELRRHLFPGDGFESVAILLCGRCSGQHVHRLLVHDLLLVPNARCTIRQRDLVSWPTDVLDPFLDRATRLGFGIVKIHSHPTGLRMFSKTDDLADQELFPSIYAWVDRDEPHASAIMLPDGSVMGRVVGADGGFVALEKITVVGEEIIVWESGDTSHVEVTGAAERIAQAFGKATLRHLQRLKIGVVGCSGTGSVIVEQLARNCIGSLVLVDPDLVEEKNLNRIINAAMSNVGQPKVDVLSSAIEHFGLGTNALPLHMDVRDPQAIRALAECDVLFGCVDGLVGRHMLNRISSYYLLPYFDVGVKLGVDDDGKIERVEAAANYVRPGGASLLSRGLYTTEQMRAAFLKDTDPDEYARLLEEGYIAGVDEDQPAVISVNMQAAAMSINDFLARIHDYREAGNEGFDRQIMSLYLGLYDTEALTTPCSVFASYVGRGDDSPLLGMPELSEAT